MYGCMSRGGLDRLWVVVDSVGGALLDSGTRIPQQPLVGCCNSSRQGNAHQCNRVLHTAPTVGAWKRPPQQQQAGGACETIIAPSPPHLDVAACDHHGSGTTRCTRGGAGRQGRAHDAGAQSPAHARLPAGGHSGLMAVPAGAMRACLQAGRRAGARSCAWCSSSCSAWLGTVSAHLECRCCSINLQARSCISTINMPHRYGHESYT